MPLEQRWKEPQGGTPQQLLRWAQDTARELRKGIDAYLIKTLFETVAEAEAYGHRAAPPYIRVDFFNDDYVPGSGALYTPNGTTSGDVTITLYDGTSVGYDIAEPIVRASMLYDLTVADAMDWFKPLLERGLPRVVIDDGDYDLDGISPTIVLAADLHLTFEDARFVADLASSATADKLLFINTNGHDLRINGRWEMEANTIVPFGLYIINGTTTYTTLVIEKGLRLLNCKRAIDNGLGCMGIYIGGAYDNPQVYEPYIYNCSRVEDGGTLGIIGTHAITFAYNTVDVAGTPTVFWVRNPYLYKPRIERVLSEEAFASANNHDCDCVRMFTYDIGSSGTTLIYNGNTATLVGGDFKDFRGRAFKSQTGYTSIQGRVSIQINGAVATGLQNANFDLIGIQGGQGFDIDTIDVEIFGSGGNDPFQGQYGGTVIGLFAPANLGRAVYRGSAGEIWVRCAGDVGAGSSGFEVIIQGGAFGGAATNPFMLNVGKVVCDGLVKHFMEVPAEVSSNYHGINVGDFVGYLTDAAFVAESTDANHALLNLNLGRFINLNPSVPVTLDRGTANPLLTTVLMDATVFGITP